MSKKMEAAKQKAKDEQLLPRIPMTFMSPMIAMAQLFAQRHAWDKDQDDNLNIRQNFMGAKVYYSSTPLSSLKPILLHDMQIRHRHEGYYLLCRIISPPSRIVCVTFGIEDTNGWSQLVSVYNFPGTYDANDLVILEPENSLLSNLRWATGNRQLPVLGRTAVEWKTIADNHFKAKEYFPAVVAYSYALRRSSTLHTLRLNRSLAHLRLGNFVAALRDAQIALDSPNITQDERVKALYRSAQAEYGQEHYENAKVLYRKCLDISPELKDAQSGILNSENRLKERSTGAYDWAKIFIDSESKISNIDIADFIGPIEVASMENRGGGRGVKATRDIKAGELLAVTKPFAAAAPGESRVQGLLLAFNLITNSIDTETHYMVHQKAIYKAACQASGSALYDLYGGEDFPPIPKTDMPVLLESPLHFSKDIDVAHIHAVCSLNQFGFGTAPRTADFSRKPNAEMKLSSPTALYTLPSYFNHSCVPNAGREQFGEVMVIRSFMKIAKGEEITITYHGLGATFAIRNKYLQKWIQQCDCHLCQQDRMLGVQKRKQMKAISEEISNPTTSINRVRNLVKQLDGLYPANYGPYRVEASEAHHTLADRLHMMATELPVNMVTLCEEAIREEITAMEALRIQVVDKKTSKSPRSKVGTLPISTEVLPYDSWGVAMICLVITASFISLGVECRAERWLAAAIWIENARSGGGIVVFKLRYAEVLKTLFGPKADDLLNRIEKSKYSF